MFEAGERYYVQDLTKNSAYALLICYKLFEGKYWKRILVRLYELLANNFNVLNDHKSVFMFYKDLIEFYDTETEHEEVYTKLLKVSNELNTEESKEMPEASSLITIKPVSIMNDSDTFCTNNEGYNLSESMDEKYNKTQSWTSLSRMLSKNALIEDNIELNDVLDFPFYDTKSSVERLNMHFTIQRTVYASEPILISFSIKNKLKTKIEITQMQLLICYEDLIDNSYDLEELRFTLGALETKQITLSVTPLRVGLILIKGITWKLSDAIQGTYLFSQLNKPPITLRVNERSGQLKVSIENFKEHYIEGELAQCKINIKNTGSNLIHNIILQTDHPVFFGWKQLTLNHTLEPLAEKTVTLNFRVIKLRDKHCIRILVQYTSNNSIRCARIEHIFNISSLIKIKADYKYSLGEYLVNIQTDTYDNFELMEAHIVNKGLSMIVKDYNKRFNTGLLLISDSIKQGYSNKIIFNPLHIDTDFAYTHTKECLNDLYNTSKPSIILLWKMKYENREIIGTHIIKIEQTQKVNDCPLDVFIECSNNLIHDYTINKYLY